MGFPDTPWQQGDILQAAQLNALVDFTEATAFLLDIIAPIGMIQAVAGDTTNMLPYWLPCDGTIVPSDSRYDELRTRIGHTYDPPNLREYRLPDLRGRTLIGAGQEGVAHNTLLYGLGEKHGDQRMQYHGHGITDPGHVHGVPVRGDGSGWNAANNNAGPPGAFLNTDSRATGISIQAAGAGQGQNTPPSLVINYVILAATS